MDDQKLLIKAFKVHGQDAAVSEPFVDSSYKTLIMNGQSLDGEDLNLNLPRDILYSQKNGRIIGSW